MYEPAAVASHLQALIVHSGDDTRVPPRTASGAGGPPLRPVNVHNKPLSLTGGCESCVLEPEQSCSMNAQVFLDTVRQN